MKITKAMTLIASVLLFAPGTVPGASADLIRVDFSGQIIAVGASPAHPLSTTFIVGDMLTGAYVFNDSVMDANALANEGSYPAAIISYSVAVSDVSGTKYTASAVTGNLRVLNDFGGSPTGDSLLAQSNSPTGPAVGGDPLTSLTFLLDDTAGNVFSSDGLPSTLNLPDFDVAGFTFFFASADAEVFASVTSLSTTAVPEPSAFLCVGLVGVGVLGLYRSRGHRVHECYR